MKRVLNAVLALLIYISVVPVQAEEQYVTDVLYVSIREGEGDDFPPLRVIKSGVKLEILHKGEGKYYLVRAPDGLEGWIPHRFLTEEPISAAKLEIALAQINQAQPENKTLREKLAELRSQLRDTEKERNQLDSSSQKLAKEKQKLEQMAKQPLQLKTENETLRTENAAISSELNRLRLESESLDSSGQRNWFLTGASVVILGILIGLILPKLRGRSSNSWA